MHPDYDPNTARNVARTLSGKPPERRGGINMGQHFALRCYIPVVTTAMGSKAEAMEEKGHREEMYPENLYKVIEVTEEEWNRLSARHSKTKAYSER